MERLIEEKNKEVKALEAQVKKLEDEKILLETRSQENLLTNNYLSKELPESRQLKRKLEAQIKSSKDEIKKLEDEKDILEKQLNEKSSLIEECAESQGEKMRLMEEIDRLNEEASSLKKEHKEHNENFRNQKEENKKIKEDAERLYEENRFLRQQLSMSTNQPLLALGKLCSEIPYLMYLKVFPNRSNRQHDTGKSGFYNVQEIDEYIEELGYDKGEESKNLAQKTWTELKKELNWHEKHVRCLKTVRQLRNAKAHPPIDEKLLYKAAKEAKENGELGIYTYNNIVELIRIWKKLKIMTENEM